MSSFSQYLKDTQAELHHVAWPTRMQTIQYTALVVGLSVFVAIYLGFFDFVFTGALSRMLSFAPGIGGSSQQLTITQATSTSNTPEFTIGTSTQTR